MRAARTLTLTLLLAACGGQQHESADMAETDAFWAAREGQTVTFLDRNGNEILGPPFAAPTQAELMHLVDVPAFQGGRVPEDCSLSPELQAELVGWEHRCVVASQSEARPLLDSYLTTLGEQGWRQGGVAGSAVWVLMPGERDCAQVLAIVASDYPRGSHTTATSEIVFDFQLEQRLRCGGERFP